MIISFMTEQGGVGKTTLCFNLGWYLAEQGKKVLLIDLDPQKGNMTFCCGIENREEEFGIYDILTDSKYNISNSKKEIIPNLYLIPANGKTMLVNDLVNKNGVEILKDILDKEKDKYDYIFIDTSPTPSMTHYISLVASDHLIIPTGIDGKSIEATLGVLESYEGIKEKHNKSLTVLAVVVNKFTKKTTKVSKTVDPVIHTLCRVKGVNLAKTKIPHNTDIDQVTLIKEGVTNHSPKSSGAVAIRELTKELFNV